MLISLHQESTLLLSLSLSFTLEDQNSSVPFGNTITTTLEVNPNFDNCSNNMGKLVSICPETEAFLPIGMIKLNSIFLKKLKHLNFYQSRGASACTEHSEQLEI